MHARYLNSIAAIIVPGNCPVERVSLCKAACSCAKRGLIIRNLAEIPIGSCVFHSISSLTAGSEHGTNYTKNPPPPPQLITRQHWHGNRDATSPGRLGSLLPLYKKKGERGKKRSFWTDSHFENSNIFSPNYSRWQKLICLREKKRAWQKYVTSPMQQWKALSSLLTSRCLPTQLALSNEVLHMVSMTGETKNNTQMAVWTGERGVHEP